MQSEFSPIVHPNGTIHACYRAVMALEDEDPLILGNLNYQSLDHLFSSMDNRLLIFLMGMGGGSPGYLIQQSDYKNALDGYYNDTCHFCYEILSDSRIKEYIMCLLDSPQFDERLSDDIRNVYMGWQADEHAFTEIIKVCTGDRCGKARRNIPLINYLANRLIDCGKSRLIDIQKVHCLRACENGPNMYLVNRRKLISSVTKKKIDNLIGIIETQAGA